MGWFVPGASPNPPTNESDGGPTGAGDAFLMVVATGISGPGGRLSVLNDSQWAGNYLGVTSIRMDVNNFGPSDLYLRLLFEDLEGFGPPVNLALSANAVLVPANSGWISIEFLISPADLVVETFGTVEGALANTDTLRIFHNPNATFPGPPTGIPPVNATLGIDNISAVPEPGTILLFAAGILALFAVFRKNSIRARQSCTYYGTGVL